MICLSLQFACPGVRPFYFKMQCIDNFTIEFSSNFLPTMFTYVVLSDLLLGRNLLESVQLLPQRPLSIFPALRVELQLAVPSPQFSLEGGEGGRKEENLSFTS